MNNRKIYDFRRSGNEGYTYVVSWLEHILFDEFKEN
jgi:hypothetical protein